MHVTCECQSCVVLTERHLTYRHGALVCMRIPSMESIDFAGHSASGIRAAAQLEVWMDARLLG